MRKEGPSGERLPKQTTELLLPALLLWCSKYTPLLVDFNHSNVTRQSELSQRRPLGERLSGRHSLPSLRRSGPYRRGLLQRGSMQPLLPRRPLRQGLSERRCVQRLQPKRPPKRLLSEPPMLCLLDQTQEWNTERQVIAVVPIITSTPSTTRTKSTYQLPLL